MCVFYVALFGCLFLSLFLCLFACAVVWLLVLVCFVTRCESSIQVVILPWCDVFCVFCLICVLFNAIDVFVSFSRRFFPVGLVVFVLLFLSLRNLGSSTRVLNHRNQRQIGTTAGVVVCKECVFVAAAEIGAAAQGASKNWRSSGKWCRFHGLSAWKREFVVADVGFVLLLLLLWLSLVLLFYSAKNVLRASAGSL